MLNPIKAKEADLIGIQRQYAKTHNESVKDELARKVYDLQVDLLYLRSGKCRPEINRCVALVVYGFFNNPLPIGRL